MGHPWLQLYFGASMRFEVGELGRLMAETKGGSKCPKLRPSPQRSTTWHASGTTCPTWENHVRSYNRREDLSHTNFQYAEGCSYHEVRTEPHPSLEDCVERLKNEMK